MPRVSIIIPTHNRANCLVSYLEDAIESALAQSYTDREIIVVDDGSEDNTQAVLKTYSDRVRTFHHRRLCTAATLNLGVSRANGHYIAFLDDDDLWLPGKLEVQLRCLETDPGLGFVSTRARYVDAAGRPAPADPEIGDDWAPSFDRLFARNGIPGSSTVMRRDLLDRLGGFDESLYTNHDYDLWLRASAVARFCRIEEHLTTCRVHSPQSPRKNSAQRLTDRLRILAKAGSAARLGRWTRRVRASREYCSYAGDCEAHGQPRMAAQYYRKAVQAFPLVGGACPPPAPGSTSGPLRRFLRPYLKGVQLRLGPEGPGPGSEGEIIQLEPDVITLKIATVLDWYLNAGDTPGGDWDLWTTNVGDARKHRSVIEHFQHGVRWEETVIFRTSYTDALSRGEAVLGCNSLDQLASRYREIIDPLFHTMKQHGFQLQFNRSGICITDLPHVHIGRAGEILFGRNGNHRLAMARVLGLPRISCRVRARHQAWQQIREQVRGHRPGPDWSGVDPRFQGHPDLADLVGIGGKPGGLR